MQKPTRLRPMPIRVTPQQWQALNDLRAEDGIAAQEHVRRAIDLYLDKKRRSPTRSAPINSPEGQPADIAPTTPDRAALASSGQPAAGLLPSPDIGQEAPQDHVPPGAQADSIAGTVHKNQRKYAYR